MEKSTGQLMEAKATQATLLDTLGARARELDSAATRAEELDTQLQQEIQAKEFLGLELHKAEGEDVGNFVHFSCLYCCFVYTFFETCYAAVSFLFKNTLIFLF